MRIPDSVFKWLNPLMIALLRSPLHSPMSKSILLITFEGRRSGRTYTLPVSYSREGTTVRCFTSHRNTWWRNLQGGADVALYVRRTESHGRAEAIHDDPTRIRDAVVAHLTRLPRDATYYDIALDSNGTPDPGDLERASKEMVVVEIRVD